MSILWPLSPLFYATIMTPKMSGRSCRCPAAYLRAFDKCNPIYRYPFSLSFCGPHQLVSFSVTSHCCWHWPGGGELLNMISPYMISATICDLLSTVLTRLAGSCSFTFSSIRISEHLQIRLPAKALLYLCLVYNYGWVDLCDSSFYPCLQWFRQVPGRGKGHDQVLWSSEPQAELSAFIAWGTRKWRRSWGKFLIKPSCTNYLQSSTKCSSKASSVILTIWALINVCKCSQHRQLGTRLSEVENLPVRSFPWSLLPGEAMKDRDRISTKKFQILMGRNIDKYLQLNYVMTTTSRLTSAVTLIRSWRRAKRDRERMGWQLQDGSVRTVIRRKRALSPMRIFPCMSTNVTFCLRDL